MPTRDENSTAFFVKIILIPSIIRVGSRPEKQGDLHNLEQLF